MADVEMELAPGQSAPFTTDLESVEEALAAYIRFYKAVFALLQSNTLAQSELLSFDRAYNRQVFGPLEVEHHGAVDASVLQQLSNVASESGFSWAGFDLLIAHCSQENGVNDIYRGLNDAGATLHWFRPQKDAGGQRVYPQQHDRKVWTEAGRLRYTNQFNGELRVEELKVQNRVARHAHKLRNQAKQVVARVRKQQLVAQKQREPRSESEPVPFTSATQLVGVHLEAAPPLSQPQVSAGTGDVALPKSGRRSQHLLSPARTQVEKNHRTVYRASVNSVSFSNTPTARAMQSGRRSA